jgi:hypothetical protein
MRVPLYHESGATYRADTCGPLDTAVAADKVELQALVHGHYPGRRLPRHALPGVKTIGFWDAQQAHSFSDLTFFNSPLMRITTSRGSKEAKR